MRLEDLHLPWYRMWTWCWRGIDFQLSFDPGDWAIGPTFGPNVQPGGRFWSLSLSLGPVSVAALWRVGDGATPANPPTV